MARYFALGPLVLVLCLVLCTTEDPNKCECEYNLTMKGAGEKAHLVNIYGSPDQTYTVTLKDKNGETVKETPSETSPVKILFEWLKPCTNYTVSVNGCEPNGGLTFTSSEKGETDPNFFVTSVTDEKVCFKGNFSDEWNLTDCVDINVNDSCKVIPKDFKLDTCDYTMKVLMPPVKPKIRFNTTIPSQFEWTNKPEQCNASFKITCDGKDTYGLNESVSLLPNKRYSCIGEYSYEYQPIKSDSHPFKIKCGELLNRQVWFKVCIFECFYHPFNLSQQLIISTHGKLYKKQDEWHRIASLNVRNTVNSIQPKFILKYIPPSDNDKAVIGILTFLIIVTSIALLFVLFKIYLLKRKQKPEDEEILLTQPLRPVEPIYADNLIEAYRTKIADDSRLFMDEFQSIPRIFSNYTIKEAKKQENHSKNRYVDILPYDYNRVSLLTGGERDYINASFIEGYREPKKYIAAQGPKDETIDDFWRMVWEQKSSIIVMVTRCEEGNKIKCAQYWPSLDRETEIFEDFVVKIRAEEHCPDYIIRYLVLANKREKAPEREVTHIQFISWPDHGVPGEPSLLLKLRRRVNSFKNFFSGPIVVHCSAGVGRTGTYIGIDAMIESLEAEGRADIYGFVAKLRRQRCLMVQVEAQYILIHTGLIEHNQFGDTELSLSEFHSELNTLRHKDGSEPSLLEMEFQRLPKFKNWRTFNTGSGEDNKKKNRYSSVIPYDFNRVLFRLDIEGNQTSDPEDEEEYSSDEEEESNEYINASFINGYWCHKSLIAAQGPLPNTTEEFLLMLYQQQTKTLVMLTDCQEDGKDFCSQYWGDEKKVFGEMEIEVKKTESFPTYVRRHLEIQSSKKKETLKVDQYQFLKWRSELPENAQELIEMMKNIRENGNYDNSKMNRNVPIVVHCNNGSSRTGIFCALWNLMDNALTEKLVDVFQEIKNLRKERQGMVETFEQYQFLYAAIEGAFPVQNGSVKTPTANDTAQIVNETTALLVEPNSTTGAEEKKANAEESKAPEESKGPDSSEQQASESSTAAASPAEGDSEKNTTTDGTTNGPAATVEV
ncbi:receptor-type tyrosine-protein phosphatase C [Rhinichthys klamathensis goyatoka]|uniref:receptor-type tyrosine-protein phosphatase C n=1 Tax=Rhinichthys klamathensis goyatoka TaxID=3034132 RepID=UPI0024B53373|nr:receptor-type tyrosine-protein phosphatase C [Rhinichthys klamathensis goyatoka]